VELFGAGGAEPVEGRVVRVEHGQP
jgi:hypothetical protein